MIPIAFDRSVGVALELPKNFQVRVTQHQVDYLGRYSNNLGPAIKQWSTALDMNYPFLSDPPVWRDNESRSVAGNAGNSGRASRRGRA